MSYDVITPSAARGMIEAIFWHPGLVYHIDRIYVLSPIRFTNIRRNEVNSKLSAANALSAMRKGGGQLAICTPQDIQQRASLVLRDVHYVIEAHFDMTKRASASDNPGKFQEMLRRRLSRGQFYHAPCFGCREFPANFREWSGGEIPAIAVTQDFGYMLYDMDYTNPEQITPMFFRAKMENGVINVADCEVLQ